MAILSFWRDSANSSFGKSKNTVRDHSEDGKLLSPNVPLSNSKPTAILHYTIYDNTMKKIILLYLAFMLLAFSSCGSRTGKLQDKAKENLVASLDYPKQLKIMAISEPDSAFGAYYFSKEEMKGMISVMSKVTDKLMEKTDKVKDFSQLDANTAGLARKQMNAAAEVQDVIYRNAPKGKFSGWKVKIDYQCVDRDGITYRAERWIFIDKQGENVVKSFELPLP